MKVNLEHTYSTSIYQLEIDDKTYIVTEGYDVRNHDCGFDSIQKKTGQIANQESWAKVETDSEEWDSVVEIFNKSR